MVTYFFQDGPTSGDLGVDDVWVYTTNDSQITIKDMVYTPIVGSPKIIIIVYTHYECSPKLNRNIRWQ